MFWQILTLSLFFFGLGESWARRRHPCSKGFLIEAWWTIAGLMILYAGGFFDTLIIGFWLALKFLRLIGI